VPEGSAVAVVIAEPLPRVPGVVGSTLDQARSTLREAGYEAREGTPAPDDRVPAGSVASQSPAAKAGLASGSAVTLIVSSGPAEIQAPKLMGLSLERAKEKLGELGLSAQVRWISRAETVTYVVLSQKPSPGEPVAPKSSVEVVINR
jgi:serine/threonine-protein kinase